MQNKELPRGLELSPVENRILRSLSKQLLENLSPHFSRVSLPAGFPLVRSERPIQWVYFLEHGVASIKSLESAGSCVEVGIIGREGLIGAQALLGYPLTHNSVVMNVSGEGLRIRADLLREQIQQGGELLEPLHTFLYALLEQTSQLVLCNRLHELEARLARWLLTTCEFMGTRAIHLTQELLAELLGVGRPAVTLAAGILQRNGMIAYSRGLVEIADQAKLQAVTCECYQVIRRAYQRGPQKL